MAAAELSAGLSRIFDGLTGFSRVAVAVSGGSDSMALLRLVVEWSRQQSGPRHVDALTVDHGLRNESAAEAQQVAAWCEEVGIAHQNLPWTGPKPATGIQAKAREARYDLMTAWCRLAKVPVLMTAHTADDQAETVAMRMRRTMSERSLAAIWPENEWHGVKLLRPLLGERREVLRQYLKSLGQAWLEDPSNDNTTFERVRMRQQLTEADIEPLQQVARDAQTHVLEANSARRQFLQAHLTVDPFAVLRVARQPFLALSASTKIDVVSWLLAAGGSGQSPERQTAEAVALWLAGGGLNRRSANGAIISARQHAIEVMREPGRIRSRFVTVDDSGEVLFDGRLRVTAPAGASVGPMGLPPALKRPKTVPALAFSALPVVKLADNSVHAAVNSGHDGISVRLSERFLP